MEITALMWGVVFASFDIPIVGREVCWLVRWVMFGVRAIVKQYQLHGVGGDVTLVIEIVLWIRRGDENREHEQG